MNRFNPILASDNLKQSFIDYITTSFNIADPYYAQKLREELELDGFAAKGPYLDVSGSFKAGKSLTALMNEGVASKLFAQLEPIEEKAREIKLERPLYLHQEQALRKANEGNNLVVTTGTGSGKTECFLIPIVDALLREQEQGSLDEHGVRAIIIYPMNALANDQMLEFCIALFMEKTKLIVRKTDRRTVMTKGMIQDALLELLQNTPYEKITVTALCKQSEITRATFYLHYNNIDDVLEELLDDALRLTEFDAIQPLPSAISNRIIENEKNIEERNPDPDALLPACQRATSNPKYRILFLDESLSHHTRRWKIQRNKIKIY